MTAPATTERPPSVWEDMLEIFYAPSAVFERRRETPAFGLAYLVLFVLALALFFAFRNIMQPVFEADYNLSAAQAMKNNPQVTAEQMEAGRKFMLGFLPLIAGGAWLLMPLLLGVCIWIVGKLFGSVAQIGQAMMIGVYALFPRILEMVLGAGQLVALPDLHVTSRFSLTLGVGRFLDPTTTSPAMLALLGRVDLFTLWVTILCVTGLVVIGRLSKAQGLIAGVVLWFLGGLVPLLGALRSS